MPKVLLAEDTEQMQRMYSTGLINEGFEVTIAPTAGQALARVEEDHFDIILLDMMLGGMSGLDFLDEYDIKARSTNTLVVALTNVDNPEIMERAKQHGIANYLIKADYDPKTLAMHLKELLAARQTPTSAPSPEQQ